ncbi:oxidoreductase FAD-binding domain protein [gamma proteobacterium HTCC5015]|nr:oxidoreductase FAD-binding domain protein [gamma proteobacterium HTCC5015]
MSITQTTSNSLWQRAYRQFSQALVNSDSLQHYVEPLFQPFTQWGGFSQQRAQLEAIRWESDQVYTLVLRPNKTWQGFAAGQFVELGVEYNGARTLRCFSISSSPEQFQREGTIELSIRVQPEGKITPWLPQALQFSQSIGLSQAMGDFVIEDAHKKHKRLMIAGGSGITPFRSMLTQACADSDCTDTVLVYYASKAGEHLFADALNEIAQNTPSVRVVLLDTERHGRLQASHLQQHCPDFCDRDSYLCGPSGLIRGARDLLADWGVADDQVHFELFGSAPVDVDSADAGGRVQLRQSGKSIQADGSRSLLDEAESVGARPQSGCRIGVCHQCKCRKTSGVVLNTRTGARSDSGPEDIQLCVSVPLGDVEIDA